jgi:hypothetical protein
MLAAPSSAIAQTKIEFTPFFASFYAISPFAKDLVDAGGGKFNDKLSNAPAIGARLGFGLSRSIGIEGSFTYAWTGFQAGVGKDNTGTITSVGEFVNGNAIMASGRVTLHPRRSNFRGILGVGYQKRGGDAWDEALAGLPAGTYDKTSIGGIVGFGVRANVTPTLAFDIDVEAFLYSNDADGSSNTSFEKKFQQDVTVAVGVPIKLSGR